LASALNEDKTVLKNAANQSSSGELPSPAVIQVMRGKHTKKGAPHDQQIGDVAQFTRECRGHGAKSGSSMKRPVKHKRNLPVPLALRGPLCGIEHSQVGHSHAVTQAHGRNNSRRRRWCFRQKRMLGVPSRHPEHTVDTPQRQTPDLVPRRCSASHRSPLADEPCKPPLRTQDQKISNIVQTGHATGKVAKLISTTP